MRTPLQKKLHELLISFAEQNGWSCSMYEIVCGDINRSVFETEKQFNTYIRS